VAFRKIDELRRVDATVPGVGPLRAQLVHGDRSNLTYRLTDCRGVWVLRRPPKPVVGTPAPTATAPAGAAALRRGEGA
jgi:aminoglycoside phosphotransferase (APT) family kinase protein